MPYIFTYNIFPNDQTENISKVYLKEIKEARAALRPLGKEVIPNAVKATTEGMSVIGVLDVKEGKLEEALVLSQKQLLAYHVIPGYKYKMEVRFKVTEALEMLGMKPPE
ncbi:MAG: hypothetical protein ACTSQW_02485 [Promethearchaeota archaeon]